jgi:hypothetical protein
MQLIRRATQLPILVACLGADVWAQSAAGEPQAYMRKIGFPDGEIADLAAGKVVARVVPEKDDNEAFVAAVARIRARTESLVEAMRKIETFRTGGRVLQIGRFGTRPRVEDVQALVFDPDDIDDFSKCRPGSCEIQAPVQAMELAHQVNWKSPDAAAKATELLKPVVSAAHVCIQRVTRGSDTGYFIAIKHIYDSHYFLADTEFLTLVPDTTDRSRFYLVDVVRARIDPPRKLRGFLLGKIKGSMKDALATDVKATRQRLEAAPAP